MKKDAEDKVAEDAASRLARAKRRADGDAAPPPAKQPRAAVKAKGEAPAKKLAVTAKKGK